MEVLMKNEEKKLAKDQTIIEEIVDASVSIKQDNQFPKTLVEALNKFQQLNVQALKDKNNPYFKSTYADLTSIINAVNQASQFGLAFSQIVDYSRHIIDKQRKDIAKDGTNSITNVQAIERDIYVETIIWHIDDKDNTLSCRVPVLVKDNDNDPQKMGSAITYAKRYGLQALYGLGQDDDGNQASGKGDKNG
jgi:hypothetical protein